MGRSPQESGRGGNQIRIDAFDMKTIHYFKGFANIKLAS
jgi:hypothetical protein